MTLHERASSLCFGTAGGFSVAGLLEALRSPGVGAWLTFAGSLLSTAAGVWIAERQRSDRGRADRAAAAELRQAARELAAAAVPSAPCEGGRAAAERAAPDLGPRVPLLFSLSREGYDEVREGVLAIRARLQREQRLRAALKELADRELDDLAVELALRITRT